MNPTSFLLFVVAAVFTVIAFQRALAAKRAGAPAPTMAFGSMLVAAVSVAVGFATLNPPPIKTALASYMQVPSSALPTTYALPAAVTGNAGSLAGQTSYARPKSGTYRGKLPAAGSFPAFIELTLRADQTFAAVVTVAGDKTSLEGSWLTSPRPGLITFKHTGPLPGLLNRDYSYSAEAGVLTLNLEGTAASPDEQKPLLLKGPAA